MYAGFIKIGWLLSLCSHSLSCIIMLIVSYREKVNPEIIENQTSDLVITSQMLLPLSHCTSSRGVEASFVTARLEFLVLLSVRLSANGDPLQSGLWAWVYLLYERVV